MHDQDGKCGLPMRGTLPDGTKLTCTFAFGHGGPCSWAKAKPLMIGGGITREEVERRARSGSVAAQAILAATTPPKED